MAIGGFAINKIFVSIAAYEDVLLVDTIKGMYENASDPSKIFAYIALQYKNPPKLDNIIEGQQLTILKYDVDTRPGVVKVRYEISKAMLDSGNFEQGDYFLMIDAHMAFAKNWDQDLINDLKYLQTIHNKKEIIISKQSGQQTGLLDENSKQQTVFHTELRAMPYFIKDKIIFGARPELSNNNIKFFHTGWACCHLFFTEYDFINDVGLDSLSQIFQEEPYLSFRCYISGYDIYSNNDYNYLGHLSYNQYDGTYNPLYWKKHDNGEYSKIFSSKEDESSCVLLLLAYASNTGPYSIKNSKRTPEMFFKHFNISEVYDNLINDQETLDFFQYLNKRYYNLRTSLKS